MKTIIILLIALSACSTNIYHYEITQYDGGKAVNFWDRYGVVSAITYEPNNIFFYDQDTLVIIYGDVVVKRNIVLDDNISQDKRKRLIDPSGNYHTNILIK